ncbi:hypothetical protein BFU36_08960 [Sulfolobus sp. A20]|uniref:DUF2299 domain-containing protein n=1 Tax=Sulfolobaceae TaxID=118883 RepID=UPI0008462055|nr:MULTISPECIES: DUF2299 domain-containing protein [unclassified Sulfolobus]TRM75881.1 DUF2299 domain-containing protein [Sulfolobus sp. B5]TRM82072.1 DUF2299 domain-containing protein [Sulfolobus sp. A20-N-F6]TRM84328.1 DUF2299 domain-containing protein [Sulfolobus sp. F3]TRM87047.1 DUF2299 domain-containing protein [Sulfolobus sp. C3]TRM87361.1 DUF2299 domain-containing protein [Sulfolobus sp. E3]TRM92666.1 DUF2299 domain-containing protein [Sulfolobus sp. A20-N-G8]TRM98032.1 DUF2299 domai
MDSDIVDLFKELGMKVEKGKGEGLYFHVTVSPPVGNAPAVSIIRPNANSKYYIVTMLIELDISRVTSEKIKRVLIELAKMNVEAFMNPPDKPNLIQIAKLLYSEGLTKNEVINAVTLVKNAGFLAYNLIYD